MNMKRMRGRGGHQRQGGGGGGPYRQGGQQPMNRNHVFDSTGPDIRLRGTAQQLFEKYLQLGRDASSAGDRVMAEGYFQHAEHYFRILNAMTQTAQQGQAAHQGAGQQGMGGQGGYVQQRRVQNGPEPMEDHAGDEGGGGEAEVNGHGPVNGHGGHGPGGPDGSDGGY